MTIGHGDHWFSHSQKYCTLTSRRHLFDENRRSHSYLLFNCYQCVILQTCNQGQAPTNTQYVQYGHYCSGIWWERSSEESKSTHVCVKNNVTKEKRRFHSIIIFF